jgi:hypothetical protein
MQLSSSARRRGSIVFLTLALVSASGFAHVRTEWRSAYLRCGGADVRALAECYEATRYCISETLTFVRGGRRAVVGLHKHYEPHDVQKLSVPVLAYTGATWACVPGATGGHYVAVRITRPDNRSCRECASEQVYDLNGRLLASGLTFDERGRARVDPDAQVHARTLLGPAEPGAHGPIYAQK